MLTQIEVSGDAGLSRSALPASEFATLLGQRVTRRLLKGDIILRSDANSGHAPLAIQDGQRAVPIDLDDIYVPKHVFVGDYISFPVQSDSRVGNAETELGPFRVLAIGDQLIRDTEKVSNKDISKLTLLVHRGQPDEKQVEKLPRLLRERNLTHIHIWGEKDGKEGSRQILERAGDLAWSQ